LGIGDWGLGIAQSPIPNPQIKQSYLIIVNKFLVLKLNYNKINNLK